MGELLLGLDAATAEDNFCFSGCGGTGLTGLGVRCEGNSVGVPAEDLGFTTGGDTSFAPIL